jgi:hypothetical protein
LKSLVRNFSFILLLSVFSACSQDASHLLPRHGGAPGELVCILSDELWEGAVGDTLFNYFADYQPLLPQAEPYFNLVQFEPQQLNNITRQHRNLLFVTVAPSAGKARVEAQKDKWASEQLVVNIYAPNIQSFDSLMAENAPSIVQKFNEFERKRLQSNFNFKKHPFISDSLFKRQKINITVPSDCDIATDKKNFMWIKRQRERNVSGTMHDILEGVFVYNYPYTNDSAFTNSSILSVRDSVLKKYVPGPADGSYMTTEYLLNPESEAIDFNGRFAILTRGLWRVEGSIMGGPFLNITIYDDKNQRVVTAEGFVFAPKFDKREYLREIEAMIFSVDF